MPNHAYRYLGLIPARGGSTRVHRKNIRPVLGKPLIYWSIKAAQESKLIDYFVVSTDDAEIAQVAKKYGAPVLDRPKNLAESLVPLTPVYKHALETLPAENLVILRPTSPIRINNIIDTAIRYYEQHHGDSLMTGFMNKEYEWFTQPDTPSQQIKGWFQGDGCVEIHNKKVILAGKSWGDVPLKFVIPEIYNHEIDTEIELIMVEALMNYLGMKA